MLARTDTDDFVADDWKKAGTAFDNSIRLSFYGPFVIKSKILVTSSFSQNSA